MTKYIAITPSMPATPPTGTWRDIRDGNLVDALMKYTDQEPRPVGSVDVAMLSGLKCFQLPRKYKEQRQFYYYPPFEHRENGPPIYYLPVGFADMVPLFQITLDDMYARDQYAHLCSPGFLARYIPAGTKANFEKPHNDCTFDLGGRLSTTVSQYTFSSHNTTRYYRMKLNREEAEDYAKRMLDWLPEYGNNALYDAISSFCCKKLGENAQFISMPSDVGTQATSLLTHGAPDHVLEKERCFVRFDYAAGPTNQEMQQLIDGVHPLTCDLSVNDQALRYVSMITDHYMNEELPFLQARHRREFGPLAPLITAWSQQFGRAHRIPAVIRKHHLLKATL